MNYCFTLSIRNMLSYLFYSHVLLSNKPFLCNMLDLRHVFSSVAFIFLIVVQQILTRNFLVTGAGFTQSRWTGAPSQQCFIKRDTSLTAWRWTTPTRNCTGQTSTPGPSPPWISVGTTVPTPRYWLEETQRGNREQLMCMLGKNLLHEYISKTIQDAPVPQ